MGFIGIMCLFNRLANYLFSTSLFHLFIQMSNYHFSNSPTVYLTSKQPVVIETTPFNIDKFRISNPPPRGY